MRVITLKVDEELLKRLDAYAAKRGISRSEVIRRCLQEKLLAEQTPYRGKYLIIY